MIYHIYKIYCDDCDYVYIGSTRAFLRRKNEHKNRCINENYKSYNYKLYLTIRNNGGWENWKMVCIDEIDVENKRQAEMKEEEWRQKLQANLNSQKCYITKEEEKEYHKQYREKNKDQKKQYYKTNRDIILDNKKEYYDENKNKILERTKQYYEQYRDKKVEIAKQSYEKNKEKILERTKQYYEKNKDKILEQRKLKITCECGCEITKCYSSSHKKSNKHKSWEWRKTIGCS